MSDNTIPEPRKASDILLAIEAKLDQLLHLSRSQDLNIKILSNKFNVLTEEFRALSVDDGTSVPTAKQPVAPYSGEIVSTHVEYQLPMESNPNGFRRTSRPETFVQEPIKKSPGQAPSIQAQAPQTELLWNPNKPKAIPTTKTTTQAKSSEPATLDKVIKSPVIQRVIDNNNKSIFNANVEVINTQLNSIVYTTRTSSTGAWQASLEPGTYKVNVKRQESVSKSKVNMTMEFSVATSGTLLKLPDLIAR